MSLFGQANGNRSYGFSLKALLEDPNLQNAPSNISGYNNLKKPGTSKFGGYVQNANSAFLGSNLWEQPSDNRSGDFDLQYMDLDEFLSENGIPVDPDETDDAQTISLLASALAKTPPSSPQRSSPGLDLNLGPISPPEQHQQYSVRDQLSPPSGLSLYLPDSPVRQVVDPLSLSPPIPSPEPISTGHRDPVRKSSQVRNTTTAAPQSEIEKCLLDDNFGIKAPVIGMGQKNIKVTDVDFNLKHEDMPRASIPAYRQSHDPLQHCLVTSPQRSHNSDYECLSDFASDGECDDRYPEDHDIAQARLPGQANFDPKKRKFSEEELKPQPIIKKSKKVFVDDSAKDEKYWSRRKKNNVAAKRSRDARRVKENQIAMRASFLESQYDLMKEELNRVKIENIDLLKRLSKYEVMDVPSPGSADLSN